MHFPLQLDAMAFAHDALNIFQRVVLLGRTSEFEGATEVELHLVLGRGLPVAVAREIDVKLDDGAADGGTVRATLDDAGITTFVGANRWGGREAACVDGSGNWDAATAGDEEDTRPVAERLGQLRELLAEDLISEELYRKRGTTIVTRYGPPGETVEEKLRNLKSLHEEGMLSEEIYEKQVGQVLGDV